MNSLFLVNLFMKKILIIGGGAMGSAFSVPCIDNNHKVNEYKSEVEKGVENEERAPGF